MFTKPPTDHTFKITYSHDPAYDTDAASFKDGYLAYIETGDASKLPRRPDKDPVEYVFRHLQGGEREYFERRIAKLQDTPHAVYFELLCRALEEIRNAQYPDGSPVEIRVQYDERERVRRLDPASEALIKRADDASRSANTNDASLILELGVRAFAEMYGNPT